jgi:hypothetical protein
MAHLILRQMIMFKKRGYLPYCYPNATSNTEFLWDIDDE